MQVEACATAATVAAEREPYLRVERSGSELDRCSESPKKSISLIPRFNRKVLMLHRFVLTCSIIAGSLAFGTPLIASAQGFEGVISIKAQWLENQPSSI